MADEKTMQPEQSAKTAKTAASDAKTPFFKGVKAEFKKIIWPTKDELTKQTVAVVVITIILGVIIAVLDSVLQLGINTLVK